MSSSCDSSHPEVENNGSHLDMQKSGSKGEDLKGWLLEYKAVDANDLTKESRVIQAVILDELDVDFVEQCIRETTPRPTLANTFCAKCQDLFDHWPTIGGSSTRNHDSLPEPENDGWEHASARSCSTFELEGSARSGCRFCAFLLQNLKDNELLDIFRKVEARMYHLEEDAALSLSIQNWGTNPSQLLWLNLPCKVCTSCNSGIAVDGKFDSTFLPASGMSSCTCKMIESR
jgi:hypothetical protein